jgi:signal transduction histidine kinase
MVEFGPVMLADWKPVSRTFDDMAAELASLRRRLAQFGFDLHDQALQDVTALRNDLVHFHGQLESALNGLADRDKIVGRVDDFLARVAKLDADLRELAVAGQSQPPQGSLSALLTASVDSHSDGGTADLVLFPGIDAQHVTDDERVAIVRVVESALTNVYQHNDDAHVRVTARSVDGALEVEVLDDGLGFDVEESRRRAEHEHRLGLRGMEERMAAVGGTCVVSSRPGGPTSVTLRLARPGPRSSQL